MKYACSLLWNHTRLHVNGSVLPCCQFDIDSAPNKDITAPKLKDGIDAAFNSELFNSVRERMTANEPVPECNACWSIEKSNSPSLRTVMNERFKSFDKKIRYIETAFSTHCNLTCRMCNEDFSSKWKQLINPSIKPDLVIDNFDLDKYDSDLSELRLVKLVGGEPMIDKQHVPFLEKLISKSSASDIELEYHTNATVSPSKKVIEFWKQFNKVTIIFSIDGVGEVNEILRPPHKWETVVKTIDFFKNITGVNFNFKMHTVISILNIKRLHEVIEFSFNNFGDGAIGFDELRYPDHLSLQNTVNKKELTQFITDHYLPMSSDAQNVIDFMNQDSKHTFTDAEIIRIENESLVDGTIDILLQ
ncbi:twitch domain-containing radical SAM protein [bacterium]|nr:twitch domain-containing radical SAM protein [bacterium]